MHRGHIFITGFTLMVIIAVILWARGDVDPPTLVSSDDALRARKLDTASLPPVFESKESGDAGALYARALQMYNENRDKLSGRKPDPAVLRELAGTLKSAMDRHDVTNGFADAAVPLEPGGEADYKDAPTRIANLLREDAKSLPKEQAADQLLSIWAMGQRLFMNNVRLAPRRAGLAAMSLAELTYTPLIGSADPHTKAMQSWVPKIEGIVGDWSAKMEVFGSKPNVGDLLRVAELDEDRTFRVEAVLAMGAAKWTNTTTGNLRGIRNSLAAFQAGSDPLLAKAARAAEAMSREQVRQMH
jgi:hypothetical protein